MTRGYQGHSRTQLQARVSEGKLLLSKPAVPGQDRDTARGKSGQDMGGERGPPRPLTRPGLSLPVGAPEIFEMSLKRLNKVKTSIPHKLTYRLGTIPIKIPTRYFVDMTKLF